MNIIEYADRDMLALDLAGRLASELNEALHHNDRVSLVVPGGTSPGPVFDDLCGAEVAWDRVDVALSDERWVPETSDRSNTRLIKDRLLMGSAAAVCISVPMPNNNTVMGRKTSMPAANFGNCASISPSAYMGTK